MRVPKHIVEGSRTPFPQGTFLGRLVEQKDNWSEDNKTLDFLLTFRDITPVEGPNVGNRPFSQRFAIINKGQSIVDIVEFDDNVPYALTLSAGLLSQLALALGAATVTPDRNVDVDMEKFLENLQAGAYKDQVVMFTITHRAWTSKTQKGPDGKPKTGVSADVAAFASATATAAEEPQEVTQEEAAPTEAAIEQDQTGPVIRSLRARN